MQQFDPSGNGFPRYSPDVDAFVHTNCDYRDVNDLTIVLSIFLSFLVINIRSCKKNFSHFLTHFYNVLSKFTFIALTETWLSLESDNVYCIPGFQQFNLYRDRHGGGIKLYVKDGIQVEVLRDFTVLNHFFEMLTVELTLGCIKYILCTVYHPPTSSHENNIVFADSFKSYIRRLLGVQSHLIVGGDFNINLLNPNNHGYVDYFINSMFEVGLFSYIAIPTKVNLENPITRFSILDQIWSSSLVNIRQAFVVPVDITDPFPVGIFAEIACAQREAPIKKKNRPFYEIGKQLFSTLLPNIDIHGVPGRFNEVFEKYYNALFQIYNIAFPVVMTELKGKKIVPWMTRELKQCIKKKERLYKLFVSGVIPKGDYTYFKNRLTNLLRRAKRLYFFKMFFNANNDARKLWRCLNTVMEKKGNISLEN